jgi:diaminopimelate decarboxylase
VLEPGKLLTQGAGIVVSRVVLVHEEGRCVVIDAALGDLPEAAYRSHPVAHLGQGSWRPLRSGKGRILGRSCMERDVLAERVDLEGIAEGDYLAFGECGAYDLSMSYPFGRGEFNGASIVIQ